MTEQDTVIGPVERDKAHAEGFLHRSGIVFLSRRDGKILLQHRSPLKKIFPNCYDCSSAFHVTFGESYEDAATREHLEETDVSGILIFLGKFTHHDPPEHQIVACYSCKSDSPVSLDPEEAGGGGFYSTKEIERIVRLEKVTPWLRDGWRLAKNHLSGPI